MASDRAPLMVDWTVRGMDEAMRQRAQAAADAAGLSLADWLERAILLHGADFSPSPAWRRKSRAVHDTDMTGDAADDADDEVEESAIDDDAQAAVHQALVALEARLEAKDSNVTQWIGPVVRRLDALTEEAPPPPVPAVLPPASSYRRGLGFIAAFLLLLSFGGAGGLAWLWSEMNEPPPNRFAEMADDELPHAAETAALPRAAKPADSVTTTGAPTEYADIEALIAKSRAGQLASTDAAQDAAADSPKAAADADAANVMPVAAPAYEAPPAPATGQSSDSQLLAQLRAAAAKNDAKSEHDLALLLMEGRIVPRDEKAATELFEKAALQGLANAQYNLGVIYDHGIGRPADQTMAYFWYSAAADQGHPAAQYNLGVAAAQGRGAPRDYTVAALWFQRAADNGLPEAQYNLGQLYENGLGVTQDLDIAHRLYAAAADQGYPPARDRMAALESRVSAALETAMSPSPSAPAPARAASRTPTVAPSLTRKDILEIQTLLKKLALLPSPADGALGPATRAAIRQYQTMAGLPATGEPSLDLLKELREVAGTN